MNSQKKARILIIGAGSIGERHLRCSQETGRAEVAICEPNASLRTMIGSRYKVKTYTSLEEGLRTSEFQGVIICTPAHLHVAMAQQVLKAGAGVLIEKPLGVSLDGIAELLRLRDQGRQVVGIAYVLRFTPSLQKVRAYLREKELGQPLQAIVVSGQHFPTFRPAYRDIYYAKHASGGGAIQDALTHSAHNVEWLLGPTESLFCDASHQTLEGVDVEDTVNLLARNGNVLVNYALNQFQAPNETTLSIHCEKGSVRIEFHRNRWGVLRHGEENWSWHDAQVPHRDALFTAQTNAFLDALEGKNSDMCSLEEGIQTLKFNLAALESARTGKKVPL